MRPRPAFVHHLLRESSSLPGASGRHYFQPISHMDATIQRLRMRPNGWVTAAGFAVTLLLSWFDYLTGPDVSFSLFYLLPVMGVGWVCGRKPALWIAVVAAISWTAAERFGGTRELRPWVYPFNFLAHAGVLAVVAGLGAATRHLLETSEQEVAQRTAELEKEVADRKRVEHELRASEERFRQIAENISEVFWMTDVEKRQMIYISPAYETIWGRRCQDLYDSPRSWLDAIEPEDRARVMQAAFKQAAGEYDEQYRVVRPDGSFRWIRDRAFPVYDRSGAIYRIAGIAEDITEQRKLEQQLLEISDREQARIGHDLHDGLCQFLVSTAFDCNRLQQSLILAKRAEAAEAAKLSALLDSAISQARQLARGLYPVQLEADGLASALEELAASVHSRLNIACALEYTEPVAIRDNAVATHLYRIVQEAVNNSVRHAHPHHIWIRLMPASGKLDLCVSDDGGGLPANRRGRGMGLHIMDYRTRAIGGTLQIGPRDGGGTTVFCSVPV
jgi:PAS domain S-box-containing protein